MGKKLNIIKTYAISPYLKTLKNNNFLTNKTTIEEDNYNKITVSYMTEKFRCVFSETNLISSEEKLELKKRDTRFQTPSKTYTDFLLPIMSPYYTTSSVIPPFHSNKNEDINIVNKIFTKAEYFMKKFNIPTHLTPEFISLTSSRIYTVKHINHSNTFRPNEHYYYKPLHIEGKLRLTVKHISEYLHHTENIDTIINMMIQGVLPENIDEYEKLSQNNMPKEWVETLYSDNIKNHTQYETTKNLP